MQSHVLDGEQLLQTVLALLEEGRHPISENIANLLINTAGEPARREFKKLLYDAPKSESVDLAQRLFSYAYESERRPEATVDDILGIFQERIDLPVALLILGRVTRPDFYLEIDQGACTYGQPPLKVTAHGLPTLVRHAFPDKMLGGK